MKHFFSLLLFFIVNIQYVDAQNIDVDLLRDIHGKYTPENGKYWKPLTQSVTPTTGGIIGGILITSYIRKDSVNFDRALKMGTGQFINGVLTTVLKVGIHKPRPFVTYPNYFTKQSEAGSYSLPSGHTSMAFTLAMGLTLSYPKWYVIAPALLYAGAIGYSRMYLGVHYPSDIAAGIVLGVGSACASHYLFKPFYRWVSRVVRVNGRRISQ